MAGDTPQGWKTALEKVFLALLKRGGEISLWSIKTAHLLPNKILTWHRAVSKGSGEVVGGYWVFL